MQTNRTPCLTKNLLASSEKSITLVVCGVMKHGKLVHTKGYGKFENGHQVHDKSLFPISSISKSITALAIMKLIEEGRLKMESKVFGPYGILKKISGVAGNIPDERLQDITVSHLLHHTGGWDQTKAPLYDPMLNPVYVSKGHNVTDIAKIMRALDTLLPYHIISYMMSQPLDYTPGSKYSYSNFGYCVLGRVIEEISDFNYQAYVKENILNPCGMWRTNVGLISSHKKSQNQNRYNEGSIFNQVHIHDILDIIPANSLDSTLGWYSTAYDLMRLMKCIDEGIILKSGTVSKMLARPLEPLPQHTEKWNAAGFQVRNKGDFWQEADNHFVDAVLYHGRLHHEKKLTNNKDVSLSFVVLLTENRHKHLRRPIKKLIHSLSQDLPKECKFVQDVSDTLVEPNLLVKYKISEHHLTPWVNAVKQVGYVPEWISGFTHGHTSHFVAIFRKAINDEEKEYTIEHGLTKKQLHNHIHRYRDNGYRYKFITNYRSISHDDQLCHLVILTKHKSVSSDVRIKVDESIKSYLNDIQTYIGEGYYPLLQTIETKSDKELVTAIFQKQKSSHIKLYHDLNTRQLEKLSNIMSKEDYVLSYIDPYIHENETRFSTIFSKDKANTKWLLQHELDQHTVKVDTNKLRELNYLPSLIVGYENHGQVKYTVMWTKQ